MSAETDGVKMGLSPMNRQRIEEMIVRARNCSAELSQIADDLAKLRFASTNLKSTTFSNTVLPELRQLDAQSVCPALPIVLGRDVDCKAVSFDLAVMPHLLVAGAMGQRTSMFIQCVIGGLISVRSPEQMQLMLFDPKDDFSDAFENLPHLQVPVIRKNNRIIFAFNWAIAEIENRLKLFAKVNVRTIQEFNARSIDEGNQQGEIPATVPYIVIVLNEFASLMLECREEATACIVRLAMKGRSAGIHLILATQCPTSDVITGTIKANVMERIAFKTPTSLESRIILDDAGAECLNGNGDCLYLGPDGILQRVQTPEMSADDVSKADENAKERCSAG